MNYVVDDVCVVERWVERGEISGGGTADVFVDIRLPHSPIVAEGDLVGPSAPVKENISSAVELGGGAVNSSLVKLLPTNLTNLI